MTAWRWRRWHDQRDADAGRPALVSPVARGAHPGGLGDPGGLGRLALRRAARPSGDRAGRALPDLPAGRLRRRLDADDLGDDAPEQHAAGQPVPPLRPAPCGRRPPALAARTRLPRGLDLLRPPDLPRRRPAARGGGDPAGPPGGLRGHRGRHPAAGRGLPVHAAQDDVPGEVPLAVLLPGRALEREARRAGRLPAGHPPRAVLPGLLLDADAADVRDRRGQPRLDAGARGADGRRAGHPLGTPADPPTGRRPGPLGRALPGRPGPLPDRLAAPAASPSGSGASAQRMPVSMLISRRTAWPAWIWTVRGRSLVRSMPLGLSLTTYEPGA